MRGWVGLGLVGLGLGLWLSLVLELVFRRSLSINRKFISIKADEFSVYTEETGTIKKS